MAMRRWIVVGLIVLTTLLGTLIARSFQSPAQWERDSFLYLQIWPELTGTRQLVAFDETGELRALFPTEPDRFFTGPGAAVPASVESRIEFQRVDSIAGAGVSGAETTIDQARNENRQQGGQTMARITGVGGVFFKSKDSAGLAAWYRKHLGLPLEDFGGAVLRWPDDKAEDRGLTVWHVADKDTKWFSPSASSFMINYRVDNLLELLEQLRAAGVEVIQGPESHENGKFAWIMDPDENKVELWEPKLWDDKNKGA
jgi:predicted enzyme related to lactoylglutathione lyase